MDTERFAKLLLLPMALVFLVTGIMLVRFIPKNRSAINEEIKSGRCSEAEGRKRERMVMINAYFFMTAGILFALVWLFRG